MSFSHLCFCLVSDGKLILSNIYTYYIYYIYHDMSVFVAVVLCLFCSFFHSLEIWPRVEQRKLILATKKTNIITKNNKSTGRITRKKRTRKKEQNLHFSSAFFCQALYSLCCWTHKPWSPEPEVLPLVEALPEPAESRGCCPHEAAVGEVTSKDKIMEPQMPKSSISPLWILWKEKSLERNN